jgi:hypothetical protein
LTALGIQNSAWNKLPQHRPGAEIQSQLYWIEALFPVTFLA